MKKISQRCRKFVFGVFLAASLYVSHLTIYGSVLHFCMCIFRPDTELQPHCTAEVGSEKKPRITVEEKAKGKNKVSPDVKTDNNVNKTEIRMKRQSPDLSYLDDIF